MTQRPQNDFLERLTLERVDDDVFTGTCHAGAPMRAFGGQIAAHALMAAGTTVAAPGRYVHSLHGYFLSPGSTTEPITYTVRRVREGGSFSTRDVTAQQDGRTLFTMTTSFTVQSEGPAHQFTAPAVPQPEELPAIDLVSRMAGSPEAAAAFGIPEDLLVSMRTVDEIDEPLALDHGRYERNLWLRIDEQLPDDPLIHACALTYLSDLSLASTSLAPHGTWTDAMLGNDLQLASIDHAVWFHGPVDANDWLLFAQDTPAARYGNGLARALFYAKSGTLIASVVQESLMRKARPKP